MAKSKLKLKKVKKVKDKGKKKGKKKWVFFLLILIVLVILVLIKFLGFDQSITSFFNEEELPPAPLENIEVQWENGNPDQQAPELVAVQPSEAQKPKRPKRPKSSYYIKIDDCMVNVCQRDIIRFLKGEKLPVYKKSYTERVKYFELISSTVYNLQRAKQKIKILDKYNVELNSPYLIKYQGRYKISFGLFLKKETGIRVKTNLARLYPDVKMRFNLEPRIRKYKVTSIYAGPFSKSKVNRVLASIQDNQEYESSERVVLRH